MKLFSLSFTLLLILSLLPLSAETPLEEKMKTMRKAFRELSKSLENPVESDQKKYLELVTTLREATLQCIDLKPQKANDIPTEDLARFIEGYRKALEASVGLMDQLKKAIETSNWTEAQKLVISLKDSQKEGHEKYRKE